jgi:hypothetical protein
MEAWVFGQLSQHGPFIAVVVMLWWVERSRLNTLEAKIDKLWEAWIDHVADGNLPKNE